MIARPYTSVETCGAATARLSKLRFALPNRPGRLIGTLRMKSEVMVVPTVLEPTSTVGGVPTTVTVSVPAVSGRSSTLSRRVRSATTSIPVRLYGR